MQNFLTVNMAEKNGVKIGATGIIQLEQEIRTVLATRKGSVPLDRDFGISWEFIDLPLTEAMQRMIAEIATQLEKYVPRIRVQDIVFKSHDPVNGLLQPTVTVAIREEYLHEFS